MKLKPPKPSRTQRRDQLAPVSPVLRKIAALVRAHTRAARKPRPGLPSYYQKAAVRVTFSSGKPRGLWAAHARYLQRDSATLGVDQPCFTANGEITSETLVSSLDSWQSASDHRLYKIILSPEFGERLDLKAHTRSVMAAAEVDLGTKLEWVAVEHHNTAHPHVHVALRGVDDRDLPLFLPPSMVKGSFRAAAQRNATDHQDQRRRAVKGNA